MMDVRCLYGGIRGWIIGALVVGAWGLCELGRTDAWADGHPENRPVIPSARISLSAEDADIVDVLRLLAEQNDLNLIVHEDVQGTITVRFHNVSLREALDTILRANGFDYVMQRDVVLAKSVEQSVMGELHTKVYALKYMDAYALSQSLTPVLSSKGTMTVVPRGMKKDAQGPSDLLIVTDTPASLEAVDALIEELDVPMGQIMIEVQLIETVLSDEEKLGIDWSLSASLSDPAAVYPLPLHRGFRFGKLSLADVQAVLNALRIRGNSKLVSNPKITTIENQTAEIAVGTTVPIPQREIDERGREKITIEERDVSIRLSVTPRLNEDDVITMTVHPEVEEITGWTEVEGFRHPITSKRTVSTQVMVKDGETIAIGGLVKENAIETKNKVRVLGQVPVLGYLFQHKQVERKKTDLLVFITPHVLQ